MYVERGWGGGKNKKRFSCCYYFDRTRLCPSTNRGGIRDGPGTRRRRRDADGAVLLHVIVTITIIIFRTVFVCGLTRRRNETTRGKSERAKRTKTTFCSAKQHRCFILSPRACECVSEDKAPFLFFFFFFIILIININIIMLVYNNSVEITEVYQLCAAITTARSVVARIVQLKAVGQNVVTGRSSVRSPKFCY